MNMKKMLRDVGNGFMKALLRSPLHRLLSKSTMLITFTGRKSGKVYTTPVNYVRDGDQVTVVSMRDRTWWRNLRGGARITLRLEGQEVEAWGEVIEDDEAVVAGLMGYLQMVPNYARYFNVRLDANGGPEAEDVAQAASARVVVKIELT